MYEGKKRSPFDVCFACKKQSLALSEKQLFDNL